MTITMFLWAAALLLPAGQDRTQRYELTIHDTRDIYAETIRIGKGYFLQGYRKEAIYFLYRALELDPKNQGRAQ